MIVGRLDARDAIRATFQAFDTAESLGRHGDLAALFLPGGVLEIGGKVLRGRGAIQAEFERLRRRPRVAGSPAGPGTVFHQITTSTIEFVSPSEARCYSRFVATTQTGVDHAGHYTDVVRLVGGSWLIAHRRIGIESAVKNSAMRGKVRRDRAAPAPLVRRPAVAGPSMVGRSRTRSAG